VNILFLPLIRQLLGTCMSVWNFITKNSIRRFILNSFALRFPLILFISNCLIGKWFFSVVKSYAYRIISHDRLFFFQSYSYCSLWITRNPGFPGANSIISFMQVSSERPTTFGRYASPILEEFRNSLCDFHYTLCKSSLLFTCIYL
jgi:hypothetical protein